MSALHSTFEAFGVRNYRLLWGGSLLSTTAFMTTFLLVPIVAYDISGSYAASGIAQAGSGIAMFFLGPFGGVIADRYPKKPLVLIGQMFPALLILGTGFLILTDRITVPLLFLSTLLMGIGFAAMGPARQAWLAELIPRRLLANGVALQQMAQNMARVLGPTLASIVAIVFGLSSGYLYILVAGFFIIVVPLTTALPWTPPPGRSEDRRSVRHELAAGFAYLWSNRRLRILWMFWMLIVVCSFAINTLLPGILDREYGRSPNDALPVFLVFGIASLAVNIPLAGVVSGRRAWPILLLFGVATAVGFWLTAGAPTYEMIIAMGAIAGAGSSGVMLVNQALMMTNSRPEYLGRVMSFIMLGYGSQSFLAPVWGGLAEWIGGRETLAVVGVIALVATLLLTVGWLRTRHLPQERGSASAMLTPAARELTAPEQAPAEPVMPPAPVPAFAAQVAPVALMGGQRPGAGD